MRTHRSPTTPANPARVARAPRVRAVAAAALLAAPGLAAAQPANDLCTAAQFIPLTGAGPAAASGTIAGATSDLAESCPVFDTDPIDVWFRITAPASGLYFVSALESTFDTTLSVWAPPCDTLSSRQPLACNDDYQDLFIQSAVFVNLTGGQPYLVRVASYPGFPAGAVGLSIAFPSSGTLSGACCAAGACSVGSAGACAGAFQGAGTACSPSPCASAAGICCRGSTCTVVSAQDACAATGLAGAAFVAAGVCNAPGSTRAPCCFADYNKRGNVDLLDIFDFLTDWFSGNPLTNHNADANPSGDLLDIFSFLEDWFAGPCA